MSKTNPWLAAAYFAGGCVMTTFVVIAQSWLQKHPWIIWPMVVVTAICFLMALREVQWFRRYFWKVIRCMVPEPQQDAKQGMPVQIASRRIDQQTVLDAKEKNPSPPEPEFDVSILQGFFGRDPQDENTMAILLEVKVVGSRHIRIPDWHLRLMRGSTDNWRQSVQLKFKSELVFILDPQNTPRPEPLPLTAMPIRSDLPGEGYVLFRMQNAYDFFDYVFGATFQVLGVQEGSWKTVKSEPAMLPENLKRVKFSVPQYLDAIGVR